MSAQAVHGEVAGPGAGPWWENAIRRVPRRGWLGVGLIAVTWPLNWTLPGLRTQVFFFPLWMGYILTVDALVFLRKGTSLWERSRVRFAALFLMSSPVWWVFEAFNLRANNWHYLGRHQFSDFQFATGATIAFTTVIPAVFGTAELVGSFLAREGRGTGGGRSMRRYAVMFVTGIAMVIAVLVWPRYFYPLVWISLIFLLEPLNALLGYRTIADVIRERGWRPVFALALAGPVCGFFWEMWNYYSYPKWVYTVPYVGVLHVFEMPLLGYFGYVPFALELYALYNLISGLTRTVRADYVRLDVIEAR